MATVELIEGEVYWWEPDFITDDSTRVITFPYNVASIPQWVMLVPHGVTSVPFDGQQCAVYALIQTVDEGRSFVAMASELFDLDNDGNLVPLKEWNE